MMKLNDLFKNTSYEDTLFSEEAILAVESAVFMKNVKNVDMPYIKCLIRDNKTYPRRGDTTIIYLQTYT